MTGANPANHAGLTLRVDPWAPEYDASLQLVEDDDEAAPVDITVERPAWGAVAPAPGVTPPLSIVDGVRRVELRVVSEVDGRICYGLFGSAAVGAARLDVRAEITDVRVQRFLVMGGGLVPGRPDDRRVRSPPRVPGHRRGGQLVDGAAGGPAGADARGRGDLLGTARAAPGRGDHRRRAPASRCGRPPR